MSAQPTETPTPSPTRKPALTAVPTHRRIGAAVKGTPARTVETLPASGHLSDEQVAEIGRRLDAIRDAVLASRGEADASYIRGLIATHRKLEVGGRALLMAGILPPAWLAGTAMLSVAKIIENMEIGHNVLHGQWDWMRDPEIHSTTWEWDHVSSAETWKISHNVEHHTYTNVMGRDKDVGYRILRMSRDQEWTPVALGQLGYYALLALAFEWGVALHDLEVEDVRSGRKSKRAFLGDVKRLARKAAKQVAKDYVVFPALAGPFFAPVLAGNLTANVVRNVWSNVIIMCGHFPEGADVFTEDQLEGETKGEWYVRQLMGSANIEGSPLFHLMSGNLSHQIEHHLFPDLPSNRYAEVAEHVRALCEEFDLPYTTGSLGEQYGSVLAKIARLSLPNR